MPSQRSKTKTIVGGYFDAELKTALRQVARRKGQTLTDLIADYLWKGLDTEASKSKKPPVGLVGPKKTAGAGKGRTDRPPQPKTPPPPRP